MVEKQSNFITQLKKIGNKDLTGNNNYPTKKQINFVTAEQKNMTAMTKVGIGLGVVMVLVLGKFFVVDLIDETYQAKTNYEAIEANIQLLREDSAQYNHIREEYNRIGNGCLNETEKILPNRLAMLAVIEEKVQPYANVTAIDIVENMVNVAVSDTSLENISAIVAQVESDPQVSFVTVSTAGTSTSGGSVNGNLSITFNVGGDE